MRYRVKLVPKNGGKGRIIFIHLPHRFPVGTPRWKQKQIINFTENTEVVSWVSEAPDDGTPPRQRAQHPLEARR